MSVPDYDVKDLSLAPYGMEKIEWAYRNMPVLRAIEKALSRGGADVALTGCNPLSTQDDVAAALASTGMHVYTIHGDNEEQYINHLKMALDFGPDIVIDDGGDFAMLLHSDLKDLAPNIMGGCEETTT